MKKCFAIFSIMLIALFTLALGSCHKPVTSQEGTSSDLRTSPVAVPPPEGMVLISAGEFQMGSNDKEAKDDEQPVRTVYVDAFYMDKTEVTNAQYKAFLIANPYWQKSHIVARFHSGYSLQQASYRDGYYFQQVSQPIPPDPDYLHDWNGINYPTGKDNHPVTFVNWYAAMAYSTWAGKRLPTAAEWERAARGGLWWKRYPWGNAITPRDANYNRNVNDTTAVGQYPANGYGLYDMVGNVSEWCLDANDYKTLPRNRVARNPLSGVHSVKWLVNEFTDVESRPSRGTRGGSWDHLTYFTKIANRSHRIPLHTDNDNGFRCVRDVSP